MKKPRLLVALGLILAAAAAIVGLAAPGEQSQQVNLEVKIGGAFTLEVVSGSLSFGLPPANPIAPFTEADLTADVTVNAKSNWPRGFTITVKAEGEIAAVDPDGQTITNPDITLSDITVQRTAPKTTPSPPPFILGTDPQTLYSTTDRTKGDGRNVTANFTFALDGDEGAGTYTGTVIFTMSPGT